jgi:hypothetical protein
VAAGGLACAAMVVVLALFTPRLRNFDG